MTKSRLVTVKLNRLEDWFTATSDNFDGFFMAWPNQAELVADIPNVISMLYSSRFDMQVDVEEVPAVDSPEITPMYFIVKPHLAMASA